MSILDRYQDGVQISYVGTTTRNQQGPADAQRCGRLLGVLPQVHLHGQPHHGHHLFRLQQRHHRPDLALRLRFLRPTCVGHGPHYGHRSAVDDPVRLLPGRDYSARARLAQVGHRCRRQRDAVHLLRQPPRLPGDRRRRATRTASPTTSTAAAPPTPTKAGRSPTTRSTATATSRSRRIPTRPPRPSLGTPTT